jgi:hypothetical protein
LTIPGARISHWWPRSSPCANLSRRRKALRRRRMHGHRGLDFRLRTGPFEGPATGKPPALPEDRYWWLRTPEDAISDRLLRFADRHHSLPASAAVQRPPEAVVFHHEQGLTPGVDEPTWRYGSLQPRPVTNHRAVPGLRNAGWRTGETRRGFPGGAYAPGFAQADFLACFEEHSAQQGSGLSRSLPIAHPFFGVTR